MWQFAPAEDKKAEIRAVEIYEFTEIDHQWIFNDPPIEILKKHGKILFSPNDLDSLKPIEVSERQIVRFQIVFTDSGKNKFDEFMDSQRFPQLFLVVNDSSVIRGLYACGGCNAIDGSLPSEDFKTVSELLQGSAED